MRVGIRADGGPSIGFGHLVRTGAIAAECLRRGDTVVYFTTTPDSVSTTLPDPITMETLDTADDPTEVVQALNECTIDTLFVDLFEADTKYQRTLSQSDSRIVVRHNYMNHTVCCDALVYGDLHAPALDYEWIGTKPEFLLGPDYVLLREQFREATQKDTNWKQEPTRALITMGGSDVSNATPDIMKAFQNFSGTVDVVIGPGFSNTEEIERATESLSTQFNLLRSPDNMAGLMRRADLAVSAVGGTVFELLAVQTPFVGIPQVDNQMQRAEVLRRNGLASIVTTDDEVLSEVESLVKDDGKRRTLFERMAGVVDGDGAKRVYEAF
ncbi:UDP-2,4-diacetamido-2,4,6-trideoxy-beta-L-altropyranose hydrolase [Natrinema marinum]|uniref:UDP-2,4-diacetamido-2,4, 6-trideoxy-beta-L-altropyranose hydrolase n=1 Tax=Natrinema marinum TaxID=2961598 RepID=UPI0020C8DFF2|nr:UDP-2,4-diacetamido-2,4,6-trideoxy-beta-L-altropyranose hydrolase [Natrinema marinum]